MHSRHARPSRVLKAPANHRLIDALTAKEVARKLDAAYWDSLVQHLRDGINLTVARELAREAKARRFAEICGLRCEG